MNLIQSQSESNNVILSYIILTSNYTKGQGALRNDFSPQFKLKINHPGIRTFKKKIFRYQYFIFSINFLLTISITVPFKC
jgi:hypothetical protein